LNVISPVREERSVTSIRVAPKFPAVIEDMLADEIYAFLMVREDAYPSLVEM